MSKTAYASNLTAGVMDTVLSVAIQNGALTGDQALALAEQFNRHLTTNGHAPAEFPRLKAARKGVR